MFDSIIKLFTYDLGIDLGTSNTLFSIVGKGIAVREPTVVARNKKTKEVVAVGTEAKKMIGRTPGQIEAIRPLKNSVIFDFDATVSLLSYYIKSLHQSFGIRIKIPRPRVAIGIPTGVTEVERKAVQDSALASGARKAYLVEELMATAIGADLPVFDATGILVVDIGGGSTQLAVISLGGIVINKVLKVAGDEFDEAIVNFIRMKYSLLIGIPTAEDLKITLGSVISEKGKEEKQSVIRGRDLATGLPKSIRVNAPEIREALVPVINQIITAIADIIEETPPELLGDITQRGVYLSGGGSLIEGLPLLINESIKIPCCLVDDPLSCVARGCAKVLSDEKILNKVKVRGGVR